MKWIELKIQSLKRRESFLKARAVSRLTHDLDSTTEASEIRKALKCVPRVGSKFFAASYLPQSRMSLRKPFQ